MKKLFFSAMACIAFAGSAFASNEVVTEAQLLEVKTKGATDKVESESECWANFTFINNDGYTESISFVRKGLSSEGCDQFLADQAAVLLKRGYTIKKQNNNYVTNSKVLAPSK